MSSAAEYVFNPDVEVTNVRRIAIRGLTREHHGKHFDLGGAHGGGIIRKIGYRGMDETLVTYIEDGSGRERTVVSSDPLAVITVNDK